jgi:tetratricopeptide (TPR) repeat protein
VKELTNAKYQATEEERQRCAATAPGAQDVRRALLKACGGNNCEEIINCCNEAIRLNVNLRVALNFRGNCWRRRREYDRAIKDLDEAIRVDPQLSISYTNRGRTWLDRKEYDKASKDFNRAIRLDPDNPSTYETIAWLFATDPEARVRDGKRAIHLATTACELTNWNSSGALDTLAAAYAEDGQFDVAILFQMKSLEDSTVPSPARDDFRRRLERYKQKKPYREGGR